MAARSGDPVAARSGEPVAARSGEPVVAFGPGRVNLIGEHTDYNAGLCLPFALTRGVTVRGEAIAGSQTIVHASELNEDDRFSASAPERAPGWRAFARGVVTELNVAGHRIPPAQLEVSSDLPVEVGLSSSAAFEVSLALALLGLAGEDAGDPLTLARLCSRVEHEWVGSRSGLLDQLACLLGAPDQAVLIDCRSYEHELVPLRLGEWRLATVDSGARRSLASSGYNDRADECARAAQLLGIGSLREATVDDLTRLPEPLRSRARHVLSENDRVRAAVDALRSGDLRTLGRLLDASHASLRDDFEVSTAQVEEAVARARAAGAAGARLTGGGFGGSVIALFPPGVRLPADAVAVRPGPGAQMRREPSR